MENDCVAILDELLNLPKKSEASKENKEKFCINWIRFTNFNGFNEQSEKYLYGGHAFCGAKPLKKYMDKSEDAEKLLNEFLNGKLYRKETGITFRIFTNLLALFLKDGKSPKLLGKLIEKFPNACQNQEGKLLGTAPKTLEKYFFKELDNENFLPLSELNISKKSIGFFINLMKKFMNDIETDETFKKTNLQKVKLWLDDYKINNIDENENNIEMKTLVQDTRMQVDSEKGKDIVNAPVQKASYLIDTALKEVINIENENIKFKDDNKKLAQLLSEEREKLKTSQKQIEELNQKINTLKNEVDEKTKTIINKDSEITDHVKMIEILKNEQSYQVDVTIQKLSSKLKVEYQDFQDALNSTMSCELGENLKQQLKNIFEILERSGLKFN